MFSRGMPAQDSVPKLKVLDPSTDRAFRASYTLLWDDDYIAPTRNASLDDPLSIHRTFERFCQTSRTSAPAKQNTIGSENVANMRCFYDFELEACFWISHAQILWARFGRNQRFTEPHSSPAKHSISGKVVLHDDSWDCLSCWFLARQFTVGVFNSLLRRVLLVCGMVLGSRVWVFADLVTDTKPFVLKLFGVYGGIISLTQPTLREFPNWRSDCWSLPGSSVWTHGLPGTSFPKAGTVERSQIGWGG